MATNEEVKAAALIIEQWHGVVDTEFLARQVLEAAEWVRKCSSQHIDIDWTHPLIREDRPE